VKRVTRMNKHILEPAIYAKQCAELSSSTMEKKYYRLKGDKDDPFSKGYICPKATALQDLHEDSDRLRHPVERTANGWKEIGWAEALDKVAAGIQSVQKKHGQKRFRYLFRQS